MLDVYRRIANRVGTNEAVHLAHLLTQWHDAMVKHRRRLEQLGFDPHRPDEGPSSSAEELWLQARAVFGDHADELEFLKTVARDEPQERVS